VQVSEKTVSALAKVVTGDCGLTLYRSGPVLVRLFNDFGANDVYGNGFPSRWVYAETNIRRLNGSPALAALLACVLDPRDFMEANKPLEPAIEYVNRYLAYDGYEVIRLNNEYRVRDLRGTQVEFESPFGPPQGLNHVFIDEQAKKCDQKILAGDFDGAITNARSLLEAVLVEVERTLSPSPVKYDGDLPKLYRRATQALDMDPAGQENLQTKQVLSGLISIVNGLAGMRNTMSDAHVISQKPTRAQARLAVNASKTTADFVVSRLMEKTGREE
jgi:hypothetical protein